MAKWKVTFEPTQCKALMLSRKRTPAIPDLYFGTIKLALVTDLSILGVAVGSKLLWSRHISNISKNAGQILGALRKIANKLDTTGRATVYKAQIRSLQHRREVAAVTVLFKMHTSHCPRDLQELLPCPYKSGRTTRVSSLMPDHALARPHVKTSTLDRTFLHSAVRIWNALPDTVVEKIKSDSVQSFKQRVNKHMMSLFG